MTADSLRSGSTTGREITFSGGLRTLLAFGVAVMGMFVLAIVIGNAVSTVSFPAWVGPVAGVGKFALLAGVTLVLLRFEGVRPDELGLSTRLLVPAVGAATGVWLLLNVLGVGLATVTGNQWGLGLLWDLPVRWEGVPAPLVTSLAYDFLVVALIEEFVFRGYLQTKVVALLGDGTRGRIGLGIVVASLVFGALHAPAAIVQGATSGEVLFTVAFLSLSGLGFGLLYEVTHNVYLVALLHALGNTWPLVADIWTWSGIAFVAALVGMVLVYGGATVAYRYLVAGTEQSPAVRRTDATVSALLAHGSADGS